ncbi:hypothetical protein [Halarchaeum sp. CBA1220]|uniref:DUF7389 domain-containing protein n=1 Tax=Halarchaeum sp. CBA1220 TaxID=1853682 RepID=UPI002102DF07|nr:hypothetical protein [Halarchaeum sp. CBA1220]
MSDSTEATSSATDEQPTETQHVERADVGVSITVQLKRGSGTRDQDKITGKVKAETLDDAQEIADARGVPESEILEQALERRGRRPLDRPPIKPVSRRRN